MKSLNVINPCYFHLALNASAKESKWRLRVSFHSDGLYCYTSHDISFLGQCKLCGFGQIHNHAFHADFVMFLLLILIVY